jgi:hypothetical protein
VQADGWRNPGGAMKVYSPGANFARKAASAGACASQDAMQLRWSTRAAAREMVSYAGRGRSHAKAWWRLDTVITCKFPR